MSVMSMPGEEPLPSYRPVVVAALLVALAFTLALLGWGLLGRLDAAIVSHGVLHADSERKTVEHLEGGILSELLVRPGEMVEAEDAEKMVKRLKKGQFSLEDYQSQLAQMRKMGGMGGILKMLPGVGKMKKALDAANVDESVFVRQGAIISSMTPIERVKTKLIGASRKRRIAAGSGTSVQEVNKLLKQHQQMAQMMKRMSKGGKKGMPQLPPGFDGLLG